MMNKFGVVLGVAAVATLAGCKDPDYVGKNGRAPQDEAMPVATEEKSTPAVTVTVTDAETGKPVEDVKIEVTTKFEATPATPVATKPAEPAYTMYTVRRGDYLAKISKRYNVTISSIKRLNPQIKNDTVVIGQKIKLPGTIAVEPAPAEATVTAAPKTSKKAADYTGATVEYVVKNGDTLGGIAYGHGINIRQLKKLNNLTGDTLKVGQKLKVPAEKVAAKSLAKTEPAKTDPVKDVAPAAPAVDAPAAPAPDVVASTEEPSAVATVVAKKEEMTVPVAAPAAPAVKTYVVQEGEDMAAVAVAFGVTASQIRELNNLGENDQLKPGQTIRLPAEADQQ